MSKPKLEVKEFCDDDGRVWMRQADSDILVARVIAPIKSLQIYSSATSLPDTPLDERKKIVDVAKDALMRKLRNLRDELNAYDLGDA